MFEFKVVTFVNKKMEALKGGTGFGDTLGGKAAERKVHK